MGSELNHILPKPRGDVAEFLRTFFPMDIETFFRSYYDTKMILLKQNETGYDPDTLWRVSEFQGTYEAFIPTGAHTSQITVHPPRDEQSGTRKPKAKLAQDSTFEDVVRMLKEGSSFVFRYEHVPVENRPMYKLEHALTEMTGVPTSIHMYVSAPGAKVLEPHTDPYDVMVFQIQGSKNWTACVPVEEVGLLVGYEM